MWNLFDDTKMMVFYIRVHLHRSFVLSSMSISQSLSIGDSVYESDWLDADLMSKKFILFIIVRSRRRVCLRAETFSIVSLQSFGSVRVAIVFYILLLLLLQCNSFVLLTTFVVQ